MYEWVLYGATGRTGRMLAREAARRGVRPLLCARNARKLEPLAHQLGLAWCEASLEDTPALLRALSRAPLVLNAAGPFSSTAERLLNCCLTTQTHYLDISGELPVFEALHRRSAHATERRTLVMPGVGYLVAATDCLAAWLKARVKALDTLRIALTRPCDLAPGSLKTMLLLVEDHVVIRRAGHRSQVPIGQLRRRFDFGWGPVSCTAISGAEVLCSFLTTGARDVEVYAPANAAQLALYRACGGAASWLKASSVQGLISASLRLPRVSSAPSRQQVALAIATASDGSQVARRLVVNDVDATTVAIALGAVERVLAQPADFGFQTPGRLLGARFLQSLPHVSCEATDAGIAHFSELR